MNTSKTRRMRCGPDHINLGRIDLELVIKLRSFQEIDEVFARLEELQKKYFTDAKIRIEVANSLAQLDLTTSKILEKVTDDEDKDASVQLGVHDINEIVDIIEERLFRRSTIQRQNPSE